MNFMPQHSAERTEAIPARDWLKTLLPYREASVTRSIMELSVTVVPLVLLWVAAWLSLSVSYFLSLVFIVPAAGFLLRLFAIQHDCGHRAFFSNRTVNDWVGRVLGVLTVTPYDVWRSAHTIHHATSGNLSRRGMGDIKTLTVEEYRALSGWRRLRYRLYRNPIVLLGLGPAYIFLLDNRLPFGFMRSGSRFWYSAMGTNAGIAVLFGLLIYAVGWKAFLAIQMPITLIAASAGVWLFYVQHQFEDTVWDVDPEWDVHEAALHGSSHYVLPGILSWFTANIGVHHVHHLCSRIPFYRLPKVLRDFPELANYKRLTFVESLSCLKLRLWDEAERKLVPFPKQASS